MILRTFWIKSNIIIIIIIIIIHLFIYLENY